jgi:hypothetical protein
MGADNISKICEEHGATLLQYKPPRLAVLRLDSGEEVLVSVGAATARVYRRNTLFGWFLPKRLLSQKLVSWDKNFATSTGFYREAFRKMFLDGLVNLVSQFKSIADVQVGWPTMKNPMEVASLRFFSQYHRG